MSPAKSVIQRCGATELWSWGDRPVPADYLAQEATRGPRAGDELAIDGKNLVAHEQAAEHRPLRRDAADLERVESGRYTQS